MPIAYGLLLFHRHLRRLMFMRTMVRHEVHRRDRLLWPHHRMVDGCRRCERAYHLCVCEGFATARVQHKELRRRQRIELMRGKMKERHGLRPEIGDG